MHAIKCATVVFKKLLLLLNTLYYLTKKKNRLAVDFQIQEYYYQKLM